MNTIINKLIGFEFNNGFQNVSEGDEYFEIVFGDNKTDVNALINACDEAQVKALWKYSQVREFYNLEDRLIDLLGGKDAFDWIDDQ
tara:strand:- start:428 stop:685 length:258 start_codon:yes stop_codon:yes gene_type:complete